MATSQTAEELAQSALTKRIPESEFSRQKIAEIIRRIGKAPCGRTKRTKQRLLYDELLSIGLGPNEVYAIAGVLAYGQIKEEELKDHQKNVWAARTGQQYPPKRKKDDWEKFLELCYKHDLWVPSFVAFIKQEDARNGRNNSAVLKERIIRQMAEALTGDALETAAKQDLAQSVGISVQHTNIPQLHLDFVVRRLCLRFHELTGEYRYGLVGQLLKIADLEKLTPGTPDSKAWGQLRQRVINRFNRFKAANHPA